jgi:hypothetical protein
VINGYKNVFPVPLAMASSWDPAMWRAPRRWRPMKRPSPTLTGRSVPWPTSRAMPVGGVSSRAPVHSGLRAAVARRMGGAPHSIPRWIRRVARRACGWVDVERARYCRPGAPADSLLLADPDVLARSSRSVRGENGASRFLLDVVGDHDTAAHWERYVGLAKNRRTSRGRQWSLSRLRTEPDTIAPACQSSSIHPCV